MKIGCLLSVREKATRLPNKVMLKISGIPIAECLLKRLTLAKKIDQIILSTSVDTRDKVLVDLANRLGFSSFCGSEEDKLARYYETAKAYNLNGVIIVDGDDLLCFPEMIDAAAEELSKGNVDCVYLSGLPLGAASIGVTFEALEKVLKIKAENDTEVWGGYFIGSGKFKTKEITVSDPLLNHPEIRLTLDYIEDYQLLQGIFNEMGGRIDFSSYELMNLLVNKRPELVDINKSAQERYEKHLTKAAPVRFIKEEECA